MIPTPAISLLPKLTTVHNFAPISSIEEIAKEPTLVGVHTVEKAKLVGGALLRKALGDFKFPTPPDGLFEIVDTRIHRLMPGMYPAIPGWHCDAWVRPTMFDQPSQALTNPAAQHWTGIISTHMNVSNTEFDLTPRAFCVPKHVNVWQHLHRDIVARPGDQVTVKPGELVAFSYDTPHRATACITRGWRFWVRVSWMHNIPEKNLTPSQTQVYILSEENGW